MAREGILNKFTQWERERERGERGRERSRKKKEKEKDVTQALLKCVS